MLYYLSGLREVFSPFNVFQYITFRAFGSLLTALGVSGLVGPFVIRWLRNRKVAQSIRDYAPPAHLAKAGTPPMGGLIIYIAMAVATLLWARLDNRFVLLVLFCSTYLWALGFGDDYLKWVKRHHHGLTPAIKLAAQVVLALGVALYIFVHPPNAAYTTAVNIPYTKEMVLGLGGAYAFFCLLILVGSSNAVNLTDGLDGLAAGTIAISALTYGLFAYLAGHAKFSSYLRIIPVPGAGEIAVVLSALVGAALGFLWYNSYPAAIFMGDTGSLFLGGTIGLVAILVKQELLLLVVGGVFVAEALSVLLQVYSYRLHGRRLFKMAPLHHHFELRGLPEPKVTIRFWIVALVLALLALSSLKLR